MATGLIYLPVTSIDYGGGRGAMQVICQVRWTTDGSGNISFSYEGATGQTGWWVSNAGTDLHLFLDGVSVKQTTVSPVGSGGMAPVTGPYVTDLLATLIGQLGSYYMPQGGAIILAYGAWSAAPTPSYPNAFPTWEQSYEDQVPVIIPPADYRPGQRKISGTWESHNRTVGRCHRRVGGSWVEMKTKEGGVSVGDPPSRKTSGTWYNQRKIGANSG